MGNKVKLIKNYSIWNIGQVFEFDMGMYRVSRGDIHGISTHLMNELISEEIAIKI